MRVVKTTLMVVGAIAIVRAVLRTIDAHYQKQMVDMFVQETADAWRDMIEAVKETHDEWHEDGK